MPVPISANSSEIIDAFPAVWRMAQALTGTESGGREVAGRVLRQALGAEGSERGGRQEHWFYHRTVLGARQRKGGPPSPAEDLLCIAAKSDNPQYLAFVRAIRHLPQQQREAFLLHHGERLNARWLGVSMDCSTTAAENHLAAATAAVEAIVDGEMAPLLSLLRRAYQSLTPTSDMVIEVDPRFSLSGRLRWIGNAARLLIPPLAILLGLAWGAWHWRESLRPLLEPLRALDRPAGSPR